MSECANCNKEINLNLDAQTYCNQCNKDFCFSMSLSCFSEYHNKNNLINHSHESILDPSWTINLVCKKEINE
jgi:hypothetical protein